MSNSFSIQSSDGWYDITDTIDAFNVPYTLAREDGNGAFQISAGIYKSGSKPSLNSEVLFSMLISFAESVQFGAPFDIQTEEAPLQLAAASFEQNIDFLRIWYVSDGCSFAKATYVSGINHPRNEVSDCEVMVRTLKFNANS